ncbi:MAG: hypothetical protein CMK32_02965 [Porticoccaceae bacterium]|nr:hypothetical protein [Porticoccaceae bacterium]|tara:strand:- start:14576 stop:14776 length:201 start_codon:yes stop_codon:yes gene_type:complete
MARSPTALYVLKAPFGSFGTLLYSDFVEIPQSCAAAQKFATELCENFELAPTRGKLGIRVIGSHLG